MSDASPKSTPRTARLWGYARKYVWWYLAGAGFLVLTNLATLAIPKLIGDSVQLMRDAGPDALTTTRTDLVDAAVMIIWLAIGAALARILSRITIFNAGRFVEFDIRNEIYRKLTTLGPKYFSEMPTGDLTSRAANDVSYVRALFAIPFLHVINAALAYGIALRKMVELDAWLTLMCLAPYPILLLAVRKLILAMFEQTMIVQEHLSTISSRVQENLTGVHVVKTYVTQDHERERFAGLNDTFVDKNMRLATFRGGLHSVMALMAGTGTLIVLLVGAGRVVDGTMGLGAFVEFNGYVVALAFPTIAMGWVFSIWHRGLAGFDRILEILHMEPTLTEAEHPVVPDSPTEGVEVEFDSVSFSYGETSVLEDVNLKIPAGSTVAIVGKTGSGKTTLMKLLFRFYDPTEGEIRIDGVPLTDVPLRETRADVGAVPQGPFLFSMTVGDNLLFGLDALVQDPTVSRDVPTTSLTRPGDPATVEERLAEALEMAGLSDDIASFPKGLDTLVGERGITLSGGQKQRVTIARALLVDPRLLVLDDALSSVDTKTEATILDHLETVMSARTSIIVTHRFNALHRVDQIFVLERGRIVERGTHDELVELGGVYARMYARQRIAEELDE